MAKEIEFKILPDGTIDINMIGYKGTACDVEMKKIIRQLGEVVKSKKKQDYYDAAKTKVKQKE